MSSAFVDNYHKLELDLSEARKQADKAESGRLDAISQLKQANHLKAQAERRVAELEIEVHAATRKANEASEHAAHATRLEQNWHHERDRANTLEAQLAKALLDNDRLSVSEKQAKAEAKRLRELRRKDEESLARADKVLAAYEQMTAAERILAGG
jgi:hypothetical protein